MDTPANLRIMESSAEVKSFIYQQIQDLEPFITSRGSIAVISKKDDPDVLANPDLYKIIITIKEDQGVMEEHGLSLNVYEAIIIAKNKLFNKLSQMYDEVVSQNDRTAQIEHAKQSIKH